MKRGWNVGLAAAAAAVSAWALLAVAQSGGGSSAQEGEPDLPPPQRGLLPKMAIANPAPWGDRRPTVPDGWTIAAIATELQIPRQTLVLPNGDILVAEGKGKSAPVLTPKDYIAGKIKSKGSTPVKGGDRLTLLRDADGDGRYEGRWVFAES
jgi:glucose/arabinose dehydrogenase